MLNLRGRFIWIAAICALALTFASVAVAQTDTDEFFPGNIFELRPPHVRVSLPFETSQHPRSNQSFPFFEAPPAIPPQDSVQLTTLDLLTLVYPVTNGSNYSGGEGLSDRLRINGQNIELDIFHVFSLAIGWAFIPASERGLYLDALPAGQYTVTKRDWYFPSGTTFDPETFEPPNTVVVVPSDATVFGIPTVGSEPPVLLERSFQFSVVSVPEPNSFALFLLALGAMWTHLRRRDL